MKNHLQTLTHVLAVGLASASLAAPLTALAGPSVILNPGVKAGAIAVIIPELRINDKANQLGAGFTGRAVSGLEKVPGGYRIRFENCDIYYSAATGAHEVHGDIRAKYDVRGGPWSDLGLPVTDETGTPDGVGRYNHFAQNGSIYWHPNVGPKEVHGGIRAAWANQGWELGGLGYPTSDERVLGPSQWVNDFQNGVLYWDASGGHPTANAGLPKDRLAAAVRRIFEESKGDGDLKVGNCYISDVTDTGYGFWESRNRMVTIHFDGWYDNGILPDTDYNMDLRLLFYAIKDRDGNGRETGGMHLFVALDHWHIHTSGLGNGKLLRGLRDGVLGKFGQPLALGDVPAGAQALSFKVMPDGGITLFLKPGDLAAFRQLLVQRALDAFVDG